MTENAIGIFREGRSALRGVLRLVIGDREAGRWFNLSTEGLIGSLIALLMVTAVSDYLPVLMGSPGAMFRGFTIDMIMLSLQAGCTAIMLKQVGRLDGFVPYLTVDCWASVFVTIALTLFGVAGLGGEYVALPMTVLVIAVAVNIGRLIVGLPALQVAMFVIAQLVGAAIGLLVVSVLFPLPIQ